MIKIRIFTGHHSVDQDTTHIFLKHSEIGHDVDYNKTFCFTNDDDYTHVILINCPTPDISHIPKENVIGLAFEPIQFLKGTNDTPIEEKLKDFIPYAQKHIKAYFIGDKMDLPDPFVEGYGYINSTCDVDIPEKVKKTKTMSIMMSQKGFAPGHRYRHILSQKILEENLPVDIYGRGCPYYNHLNDVRLKGPFQKNEPYEHYMFHIAIENFECNHYFSEKITNTLLWHTTPIYLGCRNIDNYFPDSVIKLNGNVDHDIQLIKNICENPEKYRKQIDNDKVKKTISIKNIINEFFLTGSS